MTVEMHIPPLPHVVQLCRSCKAQMIFLHTAGGKAIPVNAETVQPDDQLYDSKRHISHFATCPDRDKWRRAR